MEVSVDIEEIEQFVMSEKFSDFLLNNITDFGTAAFIIQVLLDKINELKES